MKSGKNLGELFCGKGREMIPNIAFRIMSAIMTLMDVFGQYSRRNFETLDLKSGHTVIDYGCGPARYIRSASRAVGTSGQVIAVDIHPLAIKKVKTAIDKYKMSNVEAILSVGYHVPIADETADVIYALDMFHMVEQPNEFLLELHRLLKQDGVIIIEDGHQPRSETIRKIKEVRKFDIIKETKSHVRCQKTALTA